MSAGVVSVTHMQVSNQYCPRLTFSHILTFATVIGSGSIFYRNIASVDLPKPHPGCILEKVSISGGKFISGGVTFAVGVQHIAPHLTRKDYYSKLKWISTRYAVFWDVEEKRGWLVNGASTLLHLVRASLEHDISSPLSDLMIFDPSKLKYPDTLDPESAIRVLANRQNLEVEIRVDKPERAIEEEAEHGQSSPPTSKEKIKRKFTLFCDIVEEKYYYLEQIMDFQDHVGGQNGIKIKCKVRKHLEGWDFNELISGHDPTPKVVTLDRYGWGWVDFVRSIEAITFVGRGFGELIRPIEFDGICPGWQVLPRGKHYLAATVYDLKEIIRTVKFGGSLQHPIKPARGLLWHAPEDMVAPCPCHSGHSHHHDPVQTFYPTAAKRMFPIRGPRELPPAGAVIFGCSTRLRFCWKNHGDDFAQLNEMPSPSEAASPYELDAGDLLVTESHEDDSERTVPISNASSIVITSTSTTMPTSNSTVFKSTIQATLGDNRQEGEEIRQSKKRDSLLMKMIKKIKNK